LKKLTVQVWISLMSIILLAVQPVYANELSDVTGTSYESAIEELVSLGVLSGYPDGTFRPDNTITRAEFAKIIVVATGNENSVSLFNGMPSQFTDVESNGWYNGYVNVAAAKGYIKGDPDGTFRPTDEISYAEVLTVLVRALGYQDEKLEGSWPYSHVTKANEVGLTDNLPDFNYSGSINRGEVSILSTETINTPTVTYDINGNETIQSTTLKEVLQNNQSEPEQTEKEGLPEEESPEEELSEEEPSEEEQPVDTSPPSSGGSSRNHAPQVDTSIPALTLEAGEETSYELNDSFTDSDRDTLTYTAVSSEESVVTVSVDGSSLSLTAVSAGSSTITVTAEDRRAAQASLSFDVTVEAGNAAPATLDSISDLTLEASLDETYELGNYFTDADGDTLTYTAVSSEEASVTASVYETTLVIAAQSIGSSTITVTASDAEEEASQSFDVTVVASTNQSPELTSPFYAVLSMDGAEVSESYTFNLSWYMEDPDGDGLTYTVESSNPESATVRVDDPHTLVVTAVADGSGEITVTATDPRGASVQLSFDFTVVIEEPIDPDPGTCDPLLDPMCGDDPGACDPILDPMCGYDPGGCDPILDPMCGYDPGGCDPIFDPTCGFDPGACDPIIDPACEFIYSESMRGDWESADSQHVLREGASLDLVTNRSKFL